MIDFDAFSDSSSRRKRDDTRRTSGAQPSASASNSVPDGTPRTRPSASAEGVLAIGIDLGCDTLKLSYSYIDNQKLVYGKIEKKESVRHVAVPAMACYDEKSGWIFGSDVEKGEERPLINVVKIKTLLSLLYPKTENGKILRKDGQETYPNRDYFFTGNQFPKFFFPSKQKNLENFSRLISEDRTFTAAGSTPQSVCKAYFDYARKIAENGRKDIEKKLGKKFTEVRYALVHPSMVGKLYESELTSLVEKSFGQAPFKVMNNGRALSMFAKERRAVRKDEDILIFDMGEDTLSVLKCFLNDDGNVVVEPAADHSLPVNIGGNDVDFSIADYIERAILKRETVGSPSFGEEGHIHEEGLQTNQYLFLKEIKKAKLLLSIPSLEEVFDKGVPVSLLRDLYIQLRITKEDLRKSVGISSDSGIAKKILKYILDELKLELNCEVKKVFLTGGLVETCGLLDYIKAGVAKVNKSISVCTFDDDRDDGDPLVIQTYEDSVYAPSVGAAIVALNDYEVSAGLAFSYGTWVVVQHKKVLDILVPRGRVFDEAIQENLYITFGLNGSPKEEIFKVRISNGTINGRKYEGEVSYVVGNKTYLVIGEPGSPERQKVEKLFQMKNISGPNARIITSYNNRVICRNEPSISINEGVKTRPYSSIMEPYVEKAKSDNSMVRVQFEDGGEANLRLNQIQVRLCNVSGFEGETT